MKAAIRRKYGLPNKIKIEEVEKPIPKANEVLVKIHNTTVNRTDCANLTAKPFIMRFFLGFFKPKKVIIGIDFAGKIVSIGKDVKSFKIGDSVMGFDDSGSESHAEYLVETEENLFPIPRNITFKQAAASIEGAHYAYTFIQKTNIKAGQKVLINGATGAIGSALVQFLKPYDVEITATCNTKNIELIKTLGADKIFDYTKEDFTKSEDKYDFIFDTVGKSTFGKCKPILTAKGVYVSSELGPFAQNIFYPLLNGISKKKLIFPIPFSKKVTIPFIIDLLKNDQFKPLIDREYSLQEIANAYEYVLTGQKTGNVVIDVNKNKITY